MLLSYLPSPLSPRGMLDATLVLITSPPSKRPTSNAPIGTKTRGMLRVFGDAELCAAGVPGCAAAPTVGEEVGGGGGGSVGARTELLQPG